MSEPDTTRSASTASKISSFLLRLLPVAENHVRRGGLPSRPAALGSASLGRARGRARGKFFLQQTDYFKANTLSIGSLQIHPGGRLSHVDNSYGHVRTVQMLRLTVTA